MPGHSPQPAADVAALRNAAIVVASLDRASADALLERVGADQAKRIRQAVVALDHVEPTEQDNVLAQFVRLRRPAADTRAAGIEIDGRLARRLSGGMAERTAALTSGVENVPFRFLHEAECDDLAELLAGEHPQTVAVVLAHLPAQRAAELIAALPDTLRVEALRRLAALEQTDETAVREVEQAVQAWLRGRVGSSRREAGLAAVSSILHAVGGTLQHELLAMLSRRDRALAERLSTGAAQRRATTTSVAGLAETPVKVPVSAAPLSLDELDQLDGATLAAAVAALDATVATLALTGSPPEVVERTLRAMPAPQAATLRRALGRIGPTALRDIEQSRHEMALVAAQLVADGGSSAASASDWRAAR